MKIYENRSPLYENIYILKIPYGEMFCLCAGRIVLPCTCVRMCCPRRRGTCVICTVEWVLRVFGNGTGEWDPEFEPSFFVQSEPEIEPQSESVLSPVVRPQSETVCISIWVDVLFSVGLVLYLYSIIVYTRKGFVFFFVVKQVEKGGI